MKGGISDKITQSPLVYLLTLEGIASTVNSVSVDDTPYYIDQGYPDDDNKDKLYLYVPKETEKVYVRERDAIATYSVTWTDDTTPTATRDKETSTPSKKPTLSFSPSGYTATVGDKEYKITDITVAEAGSGSAPTTASLSGQRQLAAATRARDAVAGALDAVEGGFGLDAVSVCVDDALDALCELTGENASEAVINEVFERFCVGK